VPLPTLPHWEQTPADLEDAIRQLKAALRARIQASGRTVEEVFAVLERHVEAEAAGIAAATERHEPVWPVIDYTSTMCSAFRTFQGWTALSDMAHDQGVLHTVPIPAAMAYLLLRPLLADVPDDDMCGVTVGQTFPVTEKWHAPLRRALTGIPDVRAGDSVWWHCDMIHGVAPVEDQQGWGNVMYIPAAPWCPRNERYAASVREAFRTGSSPDDFPAEHYERDWPDRFQPAGLNETGRRGLGLT
jgi:hypothetical protein